MRFTSSPDEDYEFDIGLKIIISFLFQTRIRQKKEASIAFEPQVGVYAIEICARASFTDMPLPDIFMCN